MMSLSDIGSKFSNIFSQLGSKFDKIWSELIHTDIQFLAIGKVIVLLVLILTVRYVIRLILSLILRLIEPAIEKFRLKYNLSDKNIRHLFIVFMIFLVLFIGFMIYGSAILELLYAVILMIFWSLRHSVRSKIWE